ncbi:MAG: hypothetical protein ACRDP1_04920 [Nocardioidaceae bacterium]
MTRLHLERSGPFIAAGALAVLLWIFLASLLFAPWWAVVVLVAWWLLLVPATISWGRRRPATCGLVPVIGIIGWAALTAVGAYWLGWGR